MAAARSVGTTRSVGVSNMPETGTQRLGKEKTASILRELKELDGLGLLAPAEYNLHKTRALTSFSCGSVKETIKCAKEWLDSGLISPNNFHECKTSTIASIFQDRPGASGSAAGTNLVSCCSVCRCV